MLIWKKTFIGEENNTSFTPTSRPQKTVQKTLPDGCATPAPPVALAAADDWWSNDELIQSRHQDSTLALEAWRSRPQRRHNRPLPSSLVSQRQTLPLMAMVLSKSTHKGLQIKEFLFFSLRSKRIYWWYNLKIKAFKWGIAWFYTSRGSEEMEGQSWKSKKNVIFIR